MEYQNLSTKAAWKGLRFFIFMILCLQVFRTCIMNYKHVQCKQNTKYSELLAFRTSAETQSFCVLPTLYNL